LGAPEKKKKTRAFALVGSPLDYGSAVNHDENSHQSFRVREALRACGFFLKQVFHPKVKTFYASEEANTRKAAA